MDDTPYKRCNIEEYSKMDIDKFYSEALPKIARGKNEKWEHFINRRHKAKESLNTFVFGRFYGKLFDLKSIPDEYSDYQYSKHSEFGYSRRSGVIAGISISVDTDDFLKIITGKHTDLKRLVKCGRLESSSTYGMNKINIVQISHLFDFGKISRFLLDNTANYVNSNCDNNHRISVSRWITATGKSGRTKEIESLTEGCYLSWTLKPNATTTEISVLSPNGTIIGEINWKTEETQLNDTEFNEVYEPLLKNGYVDIYSVQLQTLIPHNTPKGRPRKALVQVLITFNVKKIEINNDILDQTKRDIQSMRILAAIDYNRKCDIIEGIIPEKISSLEDLFSDDAFPAENPFVTYDVFQSIGFLSGSAFTINELEEIWNIYMPIETFCSLNERGMSLLKDGNTRLFCKRHYFNYVLDYEHELMVCGDDSIHRNTLRLSLYRNE